MTAGSQEQISRFIDECEAFNGLAPDARAGLVQIAKVRNFSADEFVFKRGETGDSLFFVFSGEVRITLHLPKGDEEVSHLKPGDFFGEIAMLTQARRTATVSAMVESTMLEFPASEIMPLIEKYPKFKTSIARKGAQRSRESLEKMIEE